MWAGGGRNEQNIVQTNWSERWIKDSKGVEEWRFYGRKSNENTTWELEMVCFV